MLPVSARISSRINMHRCVMPPAAASLAATCWCCRPSLLLHPDSKMSTSFEEPSRSLGWRPNTEPATNVFSKHVHDMIGPHREEFFRIKCQATHTYTRCQVLLLLARILPVRPIVRSCLLLAGITLCTNCTHAHATTHDVADTLSSGLVCLSSPRIISVPLSVASFPPFERGRQPRIHQPAGE